MKFNYPVLWLSSFSSRALILFGQITTKHEFFHCEIFSLSLFFFLKDSHFPNKDYIIKTEYLGKNLQIITIVKL